MEKETLISNLKSKVGENDFCVLSERTVDNIVESFLPMFADDEKVTDETYALPISVIKSYVGQYRHDVKDGIGKGVAESKSAWETEQKAVQEKAISEAIAKAKGEWEEANQKQKEGKGGEKEDDVAKKIDDAIAKALGGLNGEDGAIGKLSKQFSDFLAAQTAKEKAATKAKAKTELHDFLIELGADESKPRVIELALAEVEIGDTPDMVALQKEAKSKYESLFKDLYGDGGKPFAGNGGGNTGGNSNEALQDFLKRQVEKDKADAAHADAMKEFLK